VLLAGNPEDLAVDLAAWWAFRTEQQRRVGTDGFCFPVMEP